jgi:hypothetical protein
MTLHFQNDAENKRGVLRTLRLHQQRHSQSDCRCAPLPLGVTDFENGYHTTKDLICSAFGEKIVSSSRAT